MRNNNARFWLPNCDEWIKAGFFSTHSSDDGNYNNFATGNNLPLADYRELRNGANFYSAEGWAAPAPHLTPVGHFINSASPNGTFDQAGNVMEWVEDSQDNSRVAMGGSLFMYEFALGRNYKDAELPDQKLSTFGFRIAANYIQSDSVDPISLINQSEKTSPSLNSELSEEMEFVMVDNPSNQADPIYNFGQVDYNFLIGKYEITNRQYSDFLNSVAVHEDPYGLYSKVLSDGILGGIIRTKGSKGFTYSVKKGWENKPVTYLSWFNLARLANFYHYGKPATGRSDLGSTEGDDKLGAYDTRGFPSKVDQSIDYKKIYPRNSGAKYWIPSQNEWYKAAYYDPGKFGKRKYWNYPTMTDDPPISKSPKVDGSGANFQNNSLAVGAPNYLSDVNDYPLSISHYKVFGMAGNVWEWTEDWRNKGDGKCWRCDEWTKGLRGGSFNYIFVGLHAANTDPGNPAHRYMVYGGRLAKAAEADGFQYLPIDENSFFINFQQKINKRYIFILGIFIGIVLCLLTFSTVLRKK